MSNIVKPTSARASSSWAKYWPNRDAGCVHVVRSIIDPTRSKRSSTSATDAGPFPGQLQVHVRRGPRRRLRGRRPAGGRATARTASGRRLGIARHGGADDRRWPGRRRGRQLGATQRANVVALRWRRPIATTTAGASRRRRPSPRPPRRSGSGGRRARASGRMPRRAESRRRSPRRASIRFVAATACGAAAGDRRAEVVDHGRDVVGDVGDESDLRGRTRRRTARR